MKIFSKNKLYKWFIAAVIILLAAVFAVLSFSKTISVYAYTSLPTGDNAIENLVKSIDSKGRVKFNNMNLNALAQKVDYDDFDAMVTAAESGEIKTSEDFGDTVVNFGSYTYKDTTRELTWIPVYLSKSGNDAILTLWLASAELSWDVVSNQEVISFSDGTYSPNEATVTWNGSEVYSNTYDSSYLRNYVLNGNSNYAGNFGSGRPQQETPNMTKFTQLTSGALSNYIATPGTVDWQKNESILINDPGYPSNNYPATAWLNDKLWIPSIYEVFDDNPQSNTASFTDNGGLWKTNATKRSNYRDTWLRTGYYGSRFWLAGLYTSGQVGAISVELDFALRPALHLNLSKMEPCVHTNLTAHPEVTYCDKQGNEAYWECSVCGSLFSDAEANNEIDEIITIPATGHSFSEDWSSNKDNHWHAATCEHTDEKDGTATHTFPETWVTDTEATEEAEGSKHRDCTVCAYRQTGTISQLAHTHKFAEGWVSDKDNHWHAATCEHTTEKSGEAAHTWNDGTVTTPATCEEAGVKTLTCTVCQATKTESIPATSHSFSSAWESDASNHWHICANECGEKSENAGHDWGEPTVTKQPTEEEEGSQTVKCTVCQYEKTETVPTLGHTHKFADGWASDEDNHWHASTCGHDVKDSNAAHEWNDGEITTPASCTEEGVKTYACTVCGKTRTESVDKIAHDLESHEAKTPTCTEKGWDEYVTCKNCDYTTKTELPALGHDWATEWSKDETNHRHECSRCDEVNDEAAHGFKWEITKQPTKDEKGLKKNICTVCGYVGGEEEIAKLVSDDDGNGDVIDLPPDKEYDLEILVKATNAKYNVDGVNVGYEVALWIIVDGERAMEYDSSKTVTLMLRVPDEMKGKDFELYKVDGIKLSPIEDYEVDGSVVTVRTTLSAEIVFHTEKAPEKSGIPWWVWLIVGMGGVLAVCVIVITVVVIKKKSGNVTVVSNNGEVLKRLGKQDEKIDKLIEITDGGFNDTYNGD